MNLRQLTFAFSAVICLLATKTSAQTYGYMGKRHLISFTVNPMSLVFEKESTVPQMGIQYEYNFRNSGSLGLRISSLKTPVCSRNTDVKEVTSTSFEFNIGAYKHAFGVGSYLNFVTGVISTTGMVKGNWSNIYLPYEETTAINIPVGLEGGFSRVIANRFRVGAGISLKYAIPTKFVADLFYPSVEEIRDNFEAELANCVVFNNIFAVSINVGILL